MRELWPVRGHCRVFLPQNIHDTDSSSALDDDADSASPEAARPALPETPCSARPGPRQARPMRSYADTGGRHGDPASIHGIVIAVVTETEIFAGRFVDIAITRRQCGQQQTRRQQREECVSRCTVQKADTRPTRWCPERAGTTSNRRVSSPLREARFPPGSFQRLGKHRHDPGSCTVTIRTVNRFPLHLETLSSDRRSA